MRNRAVPAFIAETVEQRAKPLIVGSYNAAFAGGDLLGSLHGEAGNVTDGADRLALVHRSPGLRAVFNQNVTMVISQCAQRGQFGRIAGERNGNDGLRLWSDEGFDPAGADFVRVRLEIGEHRNGLLKEN